MNEEFRLLQESTARPHFAIEWQASEAASRSSKSDAGNISKHLELNAQLASKAQKVEGILRDLTGCRLAREAFAGRHFISPFHFSFMAFFHL